MPSDKQITPDVSPVSDIPERVFTSMAAIAGMELELFSCLAEGESDADSIAQKLGLDPTRLARLLFALVNAKLVLVRDGRFSNTTAADHYLVKGKPTYLGDAWEIWRGLFEATMQTAKSVRTGEPASYHDFETMSEDEKGAFFRGLHGGAKVAGRTLARTLDFSRFSDLLDVGGGSGGVAIGACEDVPTLHGTVAELPQVVDVANRFIAEEKMSDRIVAIGVDLCSETPSGKYGVAVLRNFLQTLSPEAIIAVLENLVPCIEPGGEVHVLGWILEDSRIAPKAALDVDMVFLNIYKDGAAYTVSEHQSWLSDAGFVDITCSRAPEGCTPGTILVSARKPSYGN